MDGGERIDNFAPYAALALLLAGFLWFAVASAAGKRVKRHDGGQVFLALALASGLTGAAFVLIFAAWISG